MQQDHLTLHRLAGFCLSLLFLGSIPVRGDTAGKSKLDHPIPGLTLEQIEADWLHQDELRGRPAARSGGAVRPEEDAAGACDGVKTGQWGFHTENEDHPWWQIDLGKPTSLDRVLLYNRCDGGFASRAARLVILLSDDAKTFRQVYRHDGTSFLGFPDKKPLSVSLDGAKARYLRIQLPYKSYFHLDEVEIFAPGENKNIALDKPATQSSTSQWSVRHGPVAGSAQTFATATVIERGLKLAESLDRLGVDIQAGKRMLEEVAGRLKELSPDASAELQRKLYRKARWAVRKMALSNPLLDFDSILFVKRAPPAFPHMSDQYYGWWSRPGGGIYVLEGFKGDSPRVRCLTEDWDEGSFLRPDLSHDGMKVIFSYCKFFEHVYGIRDKVDKKNLPEDAFYKIYEMNIDGSGVRQLTRGKYDDFDSRYLPSGDIVFLSTRKGQSVQVSKATAAASDRADLPDSYVRCGGDNWRPVPVFTLHCIDGDGGNIRPISAFENFEWTPSVAGDGRILYARWDYIDRFNGPFMSLWSTNPDGTNPQLVYGNFTTKPQCVFEARSIPNSHKIVFTAAAHHSNMGGSLAILDRNRGYEFEEPLTRLTPEVCFPETEGWPDHYYANPYPLSEEYFLVTWSDRKLPPHTFVTDHRNPTNSMGVYLYDAFGNLEPLYRDPDISSMYPLPVRPREEPPVYPMHFSWDDPQEGRFFLQDVYQGLTGVERGSVKSLRIVGVPPKVQPHMNSPVLGVSREDPGKFVLGTVPVEEDGSSYFYVPPGIPVFFQALDRKGMAIRTMRTLTYVQPKQTLSCIGCHESRDVAPAVQSLPLAIRRGPSKLAPGPEGSWPLRFDRLVQPVLDRHCVSCHSSKGSDEKAARFDLTPAHSYQRLISWGEKDLEKLAFEKDRSLIGDTPSRKSKLMALVTGEEPHEGVRLDSDSFNRLVTWMDVYAQRLGHFSDGQEKELEKLRETVAAILEN